jgi:alpha-D-ribose 1-methylphosphonate 5-triphosphate synthase subunit PhnL
VVIGVPERGSRRAALSDGLDTDFQCHPDPLLPAPDQHSYAAAHGTFPMAVLPYRRGRRPGRPGKPRPHTRVCATSAFGLQASSGGRADANLCVTKASAMGERRKSEETVAEVMLRTEALAKGFTLHLQGGVHIPVLASVELELHAGECIALSGPSGAGKSTLMRSLYGNYRAEAGRILVRHHGAMVDIATADPRTILAVRRNTLGYVSQFLRVVPRVPALDVVAEVLAARGETMEAAREQARALLLRLNIPRRLHGLPPATFSGGEQQRVNLARGFIGGHPVLLLDEPTASLDAENGEVVIGMIQDAKRAGRAIIGIFHDAEVRDAVADRLFPVMPLQDAA